MPLDIDFQNWIFKLNYFSFKYILIINFVVLTFSLILLSCVTSWQHFPLSLLSPVFSPHFPYSPGPPDPTPNPLRKERVYVTSTIHGIIC